MNPVTMREIRERFRRTRSVVFLTLWIGMITGFGYLTYLAARAWVGNIGFFGGMSPLLISSSLGRTMFELVSLLLLSAMLLVVPGVAALSIVGERERLTLPLLQVSQLTPRQIVFGKLGSSLAYQLLLLVSVAPILLIPMLFGGVGFTDVLAAVAVIGVTSIVVGSFSVWVSSRARSTRGAVAGSYLWTFALAFVSALLLVGEVFLFAPSQFDTWGSEGRELYAAWLNPYIALVSAVDEPVSVDEQFIVRATPFDPIDELLRRRQFGRLGEGFVATEPVPEIVVERGGFVEQPVAEARPVAPTRGPIWVRSLVLAAAVTAVTLWRAARHVSVPRSLRRWGIRRPPRREVADAAA